MLLVTSPRGVPTAARVAAGREVHALAPATASALEAAGVRVARSVTGGVQDLVRGLELTEAVLLTSDLGVENARRWPGLRAVATHRTTCPPSLPGEAVTALAGEYAVLVASPSAVTNLERLAPGAIARARRVLCHGQSTLDAARAHGALAPEPYRLEAPDAP
ncbi:MAG: uroporphyrinogen-III synthase [Deltaproteobacteria bacterium]|nr:uroporphyrinogen-III synthase [Deltaproteobacteria bacterium]